MYDIISDYDVTDDFHLKTLRPNLILGFKLFLFFNMVSLNFSELYSAIFQYFYAITEILSSNSFVALRPRRFQMTIIFKINDI